MTIKIEYFSDVLCIWAFGGQVRVDELKTDFAHEVDIEYRFVPIFAAARHNIQHNWHDRGGFAGYNKHVLEVAANWDHVQVNPAVWLESTPETSTTAHLYLKAIQLLSQQGEIAEQSNPSWQGRSVFEQAIWMFRQAFFQHAKNIATRTVQDEIATELQLPLAAIHDVIDCGKAHAELYLDDEAKQRYNIPGSPTMVLNEGRQLLYGNVGYRIIDANVRELLNNQHHGEASWC
jgi:predicted DsbA family dithiol-disulfide isomerase